MTKRINFEALSEFIKEKINPASDHLAGLGIDITEYNYRLASRYEDGDKEPTYFHMHIFHLRFDESRPNSYVEYWFKNEFDDDKAPYIQVNFSSVEGCASALVMY